MNEPLLVHASFGAGHRTAAIALQNYLGVLAQDLLDFCHPVLRQFYFSGYRLITSSLPWLWRLLFNLSCFKFFDQLTNAFNRLVFKDFIALVKTTKPRVIVTTHFFVAPLLAKIKEKYNLKIICIITDFKVHPVWVSEAVDLYFAPNQDSHDDLIKLGVDRNKIISGYVSLREGFLEDTLDLEFKQRYFSSDKTAVLFIVSYPPMNKIVLDTLERIKERFSVVVLYGANHSLKRELERRNFSGIKHYGYFDDMSDLMCAADIIVTKPGGLTVFEGLSQKKLFIVTHYIPGQEKGNLDFLLAHGIGIYACNDNDLVAGINYFAGNYQKIIQDYPVRLADIRIVLKGAIEKLVNS